MDKSGRVSSQDYRQAEIIDLNEAAAFFRGQGYTVVELQQWWRHVHGHLRREEADYFVKLASTATVGERTANEAAFYRQVRRFLPPDSPLLLPKVHITGFWGERFFYLAEFVEGSPLAERYPPATADLASWIERIAQASVVLGSLDVSPIRLPRNQDDKRGPAKERYLANAQGWKDEVNVPILDAVMEVARQLPDEPVAALNHGDYVPWHMLSLDEQFILVDAEHASVQTPLGYDIVYCYHRLATAVNAPQLATALVRAYRSFLQPRQLAQFDRQFRPLMALRVVGGFWDAKNDQTSSLPHQRLAELVLAHELF